MSDETEAHEYRLGSPLASIIGLADATLEREDLDEDVATRVRAIRDIAFDALRKAERGDRESGQPRPPASGTGESPEREGYRCPSRR